MKILDVALERKPDRHWIQVELEDLFSTKLRVKLLKILVKRRELNISSLVKETASNHSEIMKTLVYFKEINLIEEKTFGRIRIICLKGDSLLSKVIVDFISFFL